MMLRTGGYDGNVLFENLELVRTVEAAGGRAVSPLDFFVRRLPPSTQHYWSQRVRQAYDEFARPARLLTALAALPLLVALITSQKWLYAIGVFVLAPILVAEFGRRRGGGVLVFSPTTSLAAPLWIFERACCVWLAVATRVIFGGMPYRGKILKISANSSAALKKRQRGLAGFRLPIQARRRSGRSRVSSGTAPSVAE
jgi:hypothetical protein